MTCEHEKKNGEEGQHAESVLSPEAETRSGHDQGAALQSNDTKLPDTTLREKSVNAMRRRAERRQTSALIALWGEVERRSGEDQRNSTSGTDIEQDKTTPGH